jgi:glycosyltransferase involved in cell wall biosynthesis
LDSIILDIRMLRHSGIGVYIRGLLEGMSYLPDAPDFIFYGPQKFRPEVPERLCKLYMLRDFPIYSVKEQIMFPESLRFKPLFHSPHYNIPLRYRGNLVVTIHDLNHIKFPENLPSSIHRFYAKYMFREAAIRASHIIAVSENTKQEIIEYLGVAPEKITVIYEGCSEDLEPCKDQEKAAEFRKKYNIPENYILALGINKPHKNFNFLIKCIAKAKESGSFDFPLVIAGPKENEYYDLKIKAKEGNIDKSVFFPGRIPGNEIPLLFAGARVLVFPSLYEGFGLPPLEAMKMGVPVAASNREPIPEICGDAAAYFDPVSEEELIEILKKVLSDTDYRNELIEKGNKNLERFNWKITAEKTLDIYKQVLHEGDHS